MAPAVPEHIITHNILTPFVPLVLDQKLNRFAGIVQTSILLTLRVRFGYHAILKRWCPMNHIRSFFLKHAFTASMLLWASITVTPAMAASVTFNFTGTVSSVGSQLSGGPFSVNQPVTGSYTFEPTTSNTGSGFTGRYNGALNGPSTNLNVTIGTYVASLAAGSNNIEVKNPPSLSADSYEVEGLFSGPAVNSHNPKSFELELEKPSSNQFNGVLLPSTPPSVSSFTEKTFRLVFENGGNSRTVIVTLSTLTAVPLPTTVILFGAGLIALVGLGAGSWRKRNSSLA
jgi:hypothetical protein